MATRHNERVKFLANTLNAIAISCLSVGALAPIAAAFYSTVADRVPVHVIVIGIVFWLGMAYLLHKKAREVLEELADD